MKYYIIAGEASGDLHASNLMKEITVLDPNAQFRCWGGDKMKEQGAELVRHYRDLAFMGFWEVLFNILTILKNISFCKKDIREYQPDALILVDYPGFNLRIASFAHQMGLKVFYYISPQLWAWKESRVHQIKKVVDKMFVILPFEKEFYERYDFEVDFVGHPLLDELGDEPVDNTLGNDGPVIALLPGSREQEIKKILPVMIGAAGTMEDCRFVVAGVSSVNADVYACCEPMENVRVVLDQSYSVLKTADAALVASGTATLETALFGVPEVVCYKSSQLSYLIAKQLIKTQYISLVNLVMDRLVVKELIQGECNAENFKSELINLLNDQEVRDRIKRDYQELRSKLGGRGASTKTAGLIFKYLTSQ